MSSHERPYFQRYMVFAKHVVFFFLIVCGLSYSLQGLDALNIHLASWPVDIQWGIVVGMLAMTQYLYVHYSKVFSRLYDRVQNKLVEWILDYVFTVHRQ